MNIEHIHFYVENANQWQNWFIQVMGFCHHSTINSQNTLTHVLTSGEIRFLLSSPKMITSPVAEYLSHHPEGVVDVAFRVQNLTDIVQRVKQKGGRVLTPIQHENKKSWSKIRSIAGLNHTLIETPQSPLLCPLIMATNTLIAIDHLVLNVPQGELLKTVQWYTDILGFVPQQSFQIQTDQSALSSQVLVHPVSGVQFPINEPASTNSQIQEFLDFNGGPGIQHIALKTLDIIRVTQELQQKQLAFLTVPRTYYQELRQRHPYLPLSEYEFQAIVQAQILVDSQQYHNSAQSFPLLLQIFTQPIFQQPTFFFEFIERRDHAQGFGEGNFQALFEAIEQEQLKRGTLV